MVYAESNPEEDIFHFRNLLKAKKFKEAESLISQLGENGLDEPRVELLETELWIEKADDLYKRRQYKSAFPYYNNAYARWRTNPRIKDRYNELAGKILVDEKPSNNINSSSIELEKSSAEIIESSSMDKLILLNSERIQSLDNRIWILSSLFCLSLLINIVTLIQLRKSSPKN